jgi:ketosteroid isomerase-like protein
MKMLIEPTIPMHVRQSGTVSGSSRAMEGGDLYCRQIVLLLTILVVVGFSSLQFANASVAPHRVKNHDYKQQVELLEQQWRTAQLTGDVATMDKLLSDDYIGISLNGQVNTKTQQLERLRSQRIALTRLDLSEMKVKLIGTIAIVTSRAEVEGTSDSLSVKGIYRYTRVYQRLSTGTWKITSFEATRTPQHHVEPSSAAAKPD